ncbi:hydrolase signal peptide protein [Bacilli bacterium]|nr:hydrolase signal peptide protein [Bacilli bacterium]GHU46628.1 hydrolase signal peptide protein [Bacilli bacterium]
MNFTTSDGVDLVFSSIGEGMPIIFIAGYSGHEYSWSAQTDFFSEHGFRCLHLDKRGHGKNAAVLSGLRISRLAKDIKEMVDLLQLANYHLISHSMGCGVAFEYLSLFGDDHVKSVTFIDSSPKPINTPDWQLGMTGLTWQTLTEANTTLANLALTKKKINTDLLRKMMRSNQAFHFEQTEPLLLDLLTKDYRDVLKQTTCPILFISGELSPLFPTQLMAYYVENAQHAQSFLAKGAGHLPYAENPDETNQILQAFLQENGDREF